jgi:nodulation protein E
MMKRVVVTGLGSISSIGHNVSDFWTGLCGGHCGIGPLVNVSSERLNTKIGAEVKGFAPEEYLSSEQLPLFDRFSQFAYVACKEAIGDACLQQGDLQQAAVVLGTCLGAEHTYEESYCALYEKGRSRVHPLTAPKGMPSAAVSQISMQFGINGPVFAVCSACSSAAHAIIQAHIMIQSGLVDVAIAGGSEAPLSLVLIKSFEGLRALSKDTCRPFSEDRSGLVLGEGAGVVVLESLEHAKKRGADIYAELLGYGMSSDAGHVTAPSVEGISRAISSALDTAKINPSSVDYINAHGTGTQVNDVAESAAINSVFGNYAGRVAVSSTKSMHGHTLGAAAGLELVATIRAIKDGIAPPTINFTKAGEGCNLDYVPNEARCMNINFALSNSFAFGGLNAVLAVGSFS